MTPEQLAAVHARAMIVPRSWSAAEFGEILNSATIILSVHSAGFALGRVVLDEAELLTVAVEPDQQRQGIGRICLENFHLEARERGADHSILEVAATNNAACTLYRGAGYRDAGLRKAYYRTPTGARIDAILMRKHL
ncbi:MAG: GNAT family N-acetyltransferase [Boseongicola sp.]